MISWHRVGQKVTLAKHGRWTVIEGSADRGLSKPEFGVIYTVSKVVINIMGNPAFILHGLDPDDKFVARVFRPVYPEIIDQLRNLDAPTPVDERVKEDA